MSKENNIKDHQCICKNKSGFFITNRQASSASAILVLSLVLLIIVSYIWGQKRAIQEFTSKMIDDSFADKINYSYYSLYGSQFGNDNDVDDSSAEEDEDFQEELKPEQESSEALTIKKSAVIKNSKNYYAELVGFGSIKSAQQFHDRCIKKGYLVEIKPRQSKGAKGKVVIWYQVVTMPFEDKSQLEVLVDKIKKSEHLKQVKILEIEK